MADRRSLLRKDTQNKILNYLLTVEGATRAEVAKALDMSKPAVSENVTAMLECGMIEEYGTQSGSVGKRGIMLRVCSQNYLMLLIDSTYDIYENAIGFALYDLRHQMLLSGSQKIFNQEDVQGALNHIEEQIQNANICKDRIKVIICASAGVFINNEEQHHELRESFFRIIDEETMDKLFGVYDCPIVIFNDVNLAAIGEKEFGNGVSVDNMAFLWLDYAAGCALILNGKLYEGASGAAGEIGYLKTSGDDQLKNKNLMQIHLIEGRIQKEYKQSEYLTKCALAERPVNFVALIDGAKCGDAYCQKQTKQICEAIARLAYNMAVLLDLEMVVIAGRMFHFLPEAAQLCQDYLKEKEFTKTQVVLSDLERPIIEGAFHVGYEWILEHSF